MHLHEVLYFLNDYLEIINREGLSGNIKTDLCLTVQGTVIATVQHILEAALEVTGCEF